jgi:hypothetical protein
LNEDRSQALAAAAQQTSEGVHVHSNRHKHKHPIDVNQHSTSTKGEQTESIVLNQGALEDQIHPQHDRYHQEQQQYQDVTFT